MAGWDFADLGIRMSVEWRLQDGGYRHPVCGGCDGLPYGVYPWGSASRVEWISVFGGGWEGLGMGIRSSMIDRLNSLENYRRLW